MEGLAFWHLFWFFFFIGGGLLMVYSRDMAFGNPYLGGGIALLGGFLCAIGIEKSYSINMLLKNISLPFWVQITFWIFFIFILPIMAYTRN